MTKDDDLFDTTCVKFDADEAQSLIGKYVFVSSSLIYLRDAVNEMRTDSPCFYGRLVIARTDYGLGKSEFQIDCDVRAFNFMYYDPYYKFKCALKRGETIEHDCTLDGWQEIQNPPFNDKPERYRIKQDNPALKWQDLKIGDILRCTSNENDMYGMVTMIDADADSNSHICLGARWILNRDICNFRRVNCAGEDVENVGN